jgi:hypothetical protein
MLFPPDAARATAGAVEGEADRALPHLFKFAPAGTTKEQECTNEETVQWEA